MNRATPIGTYAILFIYWLLFLTFDLHSSSRGNLIRAGAQLNEYVWAGEYWRLLSACFVHIGILHIAVNSYFLWMVGPTLERELGLERFLLLYVVSGIGGSVAVGLWYPPGAVCAGGSGSLFGFLGALIAILLRQEHSYRDFLDNMAGRQLLSLIAINLVLGFVIPIISNTAHIGGLVTGFLFAFTLLNLPEAGQRIARPRPAPAAAFAITLLTLGAFACRPVTSPTYQQAALWRQQDPDRAMEIQACMKARGFPPFWLDVLRTGGQLSRNDTEENLRSFRQSVRTYRLALRINPRLRHRHIDTLLQSFEKADKDERDPVSTLPREFWLTDA